MSSKWSRLPDYSRSAALRQLVRQGVPDELRCEVWLNLCGGKDSMTTNPTLYHTLLTSDTEYIAHDIRCIELDIPRTFSTDPELQAELSDVLKRVLTAYSLHRPDHGYLSGMTWVAGFILSATKVEGRVMEEEAFWMLDGLLNNVIPGCFEADGIATNRAIEGTAQILNKDYTKLMKHFEKHGCGLHTLTYRWLRIMFVNIVPTELLLRVWDCMFYEGVGVLINMTVCLISFNKKELLACCSYEELIEVKYGLGTSKEIDCKVYMKRLVKLLK